MTKTTTNQSANQHISRDAKLHVSTSKNQHISTSANQQIILSIQQILADNVPELKYIDRDWNQFSYEQPPVKFPCALIDLQNVEYRHMTNTLQRAAATIAIRVADTRLIPASMASARKEDSYRIHHIIDRIHRTLNMFTGTPSGDPALFTPLIRTSLDKENVSSSYEMYTISYRTTYDDPIK